MIFLDNAAGSWPKPPQVKQALALAPEKYGANPGRGAYRMSFDTSRMVLECRTALAELFNIPAIERLTFSAGATESLNTAIFGLLNKGDHVIYSSMEHNAVWRPLAYLESLGTIALSRVNADKYGYVNPEDFEALITPKTRLITCVHASNVCGSVQPIAQIGAIAAAHNIPFLVDCAQGAGLFDIDVQQMNISLLAFAGHKSLYGPAGIGGLYVSESVRIKPMILGGTGSHSDQWQQPEYYPDHLESGSINTVGISALKAALGFVCDKSIAEIYGHTMELCDLLAEKLAVIRGVHLYLPPEKRLRAPVLSLTIDNVDCAEAAFILDSDYQIAVRSGLHCTPLAHKSLGTFESGSLRFSVGWFNTAADIETAAKAIAAIAKRGYIASK